MEEARSELEFDEFERLLREIPKATSANSHYEALTSRNLSLEGSLPPIHLNPCKGASHELLQKNEGLDDGNLLMDIAQRSPIKKVKSLKPDIPDDQSSAKAIGELHFGDSLAETSFHTSVNCKLQDHAVTLNHWYPSELKKLPPKTDPEENIVPPFRAINDVSYGYREAEVTKLGHQSVDLLRLDAQEIKKLQAEHFSAAFPLSHGAESFQFVPGGVPLQNWDFHAMSNQLPCFVNGRSHFPHLYSHKPSQPHINLGTVEEERCYRINQQYISTQQLHNQGFEAQQFHATGDPPARTTCRIPRKPYLDLPAARQAERSNLEPCSNKIVASAALNQSRHALSSASMNPLHYLDKVTVKSFHEKPPTRLNAFNKSKDLKFGSVVGKESFPITNHNGKAGYFHHSFSYGNTGCLQHDDLDSWVLPSNIKATILRSMPQRYNSVEEVRGRIYHMAKDQHGCRFLQRKFSEGTAEDVKKIFGEIIDHIVELMTDPFGNYLVQKLLEVCGEDQTLQILHAITKKAGDLVRISCDMHGTRAVQKVIETLKTQEQFSIVVSSLQPGIVILIKNMNGNHVAQRCLQYLTPEYKKFLFEAATTNCIELATDRHGCCVLQKCLIHSEGEQQKKLVAGITSNALLLSQDPFGNYVVQFVFELQLPWATTHIFKQLEGKYGDLSMLKYSSNVVEKCLRYANEEQCGRIVWELINTARLEQVMQDPYGNYVIQAALNQSKGAVQGALVDAIRPLVPLLRTSPYGKKVLSCNGLKK